MPINFKPNYIITTKIIHDLMRIQSAKDAIQHLPLTPAVLRSLRETARLNTTYYSIIIEGNKLNSNQMKAVIQENAHYPGFERDEDEAKGYYAGIAQVEQWVASKTKITEKMLQELHAIIMSRGKIKNKPTQYRDGQNVIRDGNSGAIVYMPPEAQDVPEFMKSMVHWINAQRETPCPIIAAIAHYQFATIHPYYDGNGRTARQLTTLILHLGDYDLKGLYSLEEYYHKNINDYYEAINVGPSHNYYMGRADADITKWIEYFINGMAVSFEHVNKRMQKEKGLPDQTVALRELDPKQRRVLELFLESNIITSRQIGNLFGFQPRTAAKICAQWVKDDFLEIVDPSNKARKYKLAEIHQKLLGSK